MEVKKVIRALRALSAKNRSRKADIWLGIILAFIAGAINAGGFLAIGYYTSHMTGIASSVGDFIVIGQYNMALLMLFFLIAFIAGAVCSAVIINIARARQLYSEYAIALMFEAILLLVFGLLALHLAKPYPQIFTVTISLLCFVMGLQNAIITKVSNAVIRTTHVTGLATDIGIAIGRYFYVLRTKDPNVNLYPENLKLHASLLLCFLLGGVIGAWTFSYIGFITVLPIALLLAVISFLPIYDDLARRKLT